MYDGKRQFQQRAAAVIEVRNTCSQGRVYIVVSIAVGIVVWFKRATHTLLIAFFGLRSMLRKGHPLVVFLTYI